MRICGHVDVAPPGTSRVLYIAYASPVPSRLGPARRHYHVLEQLARFYDVHFLCVGDAARPRPSSATSAIGCAASPSCRVRPAFAGATPGSWRGRCMGRCDFLPALEPALRQACAGVTAHTPSTPSCCRRCCCARCRCRTHVPIVGDTHNVEFDVLRRTAAHADRVLLRHYARRQWPATLREERRCGEAVDLLLATSARDRHVFERELGLRRVAVVPNGIDLAEFVPSTSRAGAGHHPVLGPDELLPEPAGRPLVPA